MKNRVFTSAIIPLLYTFGYFASRNYSAYQCVGRKFAIVFLLCISLCGYLFPTIKRSIGLISRRDLISAQLELVQQASDFRIATMGASFAVEYLPAFALSRSIPPKVFINTYCMMGSPLNFSSFNELVDSDIALFVTKPDMCEDIISDIQRNYGVSANPNILVEDDKFAIIRLTSE